MERTGHRVTVHLVIPCKRKICTCPLCRRCHSRRCVAMCVCIAVQYSTAQYLACISPVPTSCLLPTPASPVQATTQHARYDSMSLASGPGPLILGPGQVELRLQQATPSTPPSILDLA